GEHVHFSPRSTRPRFPGERKREREGERQREREREREREQPASRGDRVEKAQRGARKQEKRAHTSGSLHYIHLPQELYSCWFILHTCATGTLVVLVHIIYIRHRYS